MDAFQEIQKHYKQRELAAREWKQKGGKVCGYLEEDVPEEMILAAGFFPLRLSGDPFGGKEEADKYSFDNYDAYMHSIFNQFLTGKYDFLDYLIIAHERDSVSRFQGILAGIQGLRPDLKLPSERYYLDVLHTKSYFTELYNRDRIYDLKKKLEEWSGKPLSNEALSRAIKICNENKTLLKQVAAFRTAKPPVINGVEALQVIGSSMFMLKEEHNKLLKQMLDKANTFSVKKGSRLFVEGSPLDNLQFYEVAESSGAIIVAEDNSWGNTYSDVVAQTDIDPIDAIAERYHNKPPTARIFGLNNRINYLVNSVLEAKADGVVFNILECDYAQIWETPEEIKALKAKGIPTLWLQNQPYLLSNGDKKAINTRIVEFIQSVHQN